jgi:Recombination endonuclease VII
MTRCVVTGTTRRWKVYFSAMTGRICKDCEIFHTSDMFYKHSEGKNGLYPRCKNCHNAKVRKDYDPKKKKNFHLKYLYGITLDEYERRLQDQGGSCGICKTNLPGGNGQNFYVDHNHSTNQVRGLICHNCNYIIGYSKENTDTLRAVIKYIDKWGGES